MPMVDAFLGWYRKDSLFDTLALPRVSRDPMRALHRKDLVDPPMRRNGSYRGAGDPSIPTLVHLTRDHTGRPPG